MPRKKTPRLLALAEAAVALVAVIFLLPDCLTQVWIGMSELPLLLAAQAATKQPACVINVASVNGLLPPAQMDTCTALFDSILESIV